jgi:hypothetical protein
VKVLVACEFSGRVRDAFIAHGHDALSVDLLPTEQPGPHYQGDVRDVLGDGWDLLIGHPPCTYLAKSSASRLLRNGVLDMDRLAQLEQSAAFFRMLLDAPVERVAIENPQMLQRGLDLIGRPSTQTIQPWQFGHGETKATCLWLRNLPTLTPTTVVSGRVQRIANMAPSPERWKDRSRTFQGIADAMAAQWSTNDGWLF